MTRRRRPVRRTVALACALLICPSAGASAAAEEGGDTQVTRVNGTNAAAPAPARAAYGEHMVVNRFFGHLSPAGSTLLNRVRRAGYLEDARRWLLGETLARGEGDVTSYALFTALMAGPAHSEIIHDGRYRQVGVGLERGASTDDGGLTVTLNFGVITARK